MGGGVGGGVNGLLMSYYFRHFEVLILTLLL